MNIKARSQKKLRVLGDTYRHRERLKAFGAVWEPVLSQWLFLEAPKASVAKALAGLGLRLEEF